MERYARRMMARVDETDRAILSALRDNSRQAFVELAKVVGGPLRAWKCDRGFFVRALDNTGSDNTGCHWLRKA